MVVVSDPMFYANRTRVTALAIRFQVPSIYGSADYVVAGGLMSYLSSIEWHWRTAAGIVDKILKGTKPGDIPVAQPTEFKLVINLKTAKALGIKFPQSLLLRADAKIQ
jgi:putative ABC transport system substrate-binding protein